MKTKKQEELVNSYLSIIGEEVRPLYKEIIMYLSELGYNPKKEKSNISFKHDQHNKQMAKMGFKKNQEQTPYFALRFSACRGYSQRFDDIVCAAAAKKTVKEARCIDKGCDYCAGEADTHTYVYKNSENKIKFLCGANAIEIPDITEDDITEIKKLIRDEHSYLMKHEAGIEI